MSISAVIRAGNTPRAQRVFRQGPARISPGCGPVCVWVYVHVCALVCFWEEGNRPNSSTSQQNRTSAERETEGERYRKIIRGEESPLHGVAGVREQLDCVSVDRNLPHIAGWLPGRLSLESGLVSPTVCDGCKPRMHSLTAFHVDPPKQTPLIL